MRSIRYWSVPVSPLAKWFGVSDSNLNTIFPNLPRFAHRDLGFLG